VLPTSQQNTIGAAEQKLSGFAGAIVPLTKFSQLEEYLAKHGTVQIYKIMKTNIIDKCHNRTHSTNLRLVQKFVNAYIFNFISLNS